MLSGGIQPVRAVLRALALLNLATGVSAPRIAQFVALLVLSFSSLARSSKHMLARRKSLQYQLVIERLRI